MRSGLIVFLAAGVVVAVALIEGNRSNRWGATEDIQVAARKLERVPLEFGSWVGTNEPLDEKIVRVAEAAGNVSRSYVNRKNRDRINVLLLCGPSGPIGAHTPDVCYGGIGFSCKGSPAVKGMTLPNGGHASFWTARFEKTSATEEPLRVYWAWSVNGDWEATANPRADFALQTSLYKLQLVRVDNPTSRDRDSNQDSFDLFLTEFLPLVKTALTTDTG
jgi:hypothetical protein